MLLTFLGTGAATAYPLLSCRCPNCVMARKQGLSAYRRRASLLVNDALLLDLGPDCLSAAAAFGVDLTRVRYLLQTHAHSDHFDAGHLITRIAEYGSAETPPLTVCAHATCLAGMSFRLQLEEPGANLFDPAWRARLNLGILPIAHGERAQLGAYGVTALDCAHDPTAGSLLYIVENGESALLYGLDTPQLTEPAWAHLAGARPRLTAVVLDHTYGFSVRGGGHMGAEEAGETFRRLRSLGVLAENARLFASHFSHEGNPPQSELAPRAEALGYCAAYDGLRAEV